MPPAFPGQTLRAPVAILIALVNSLPDLLIVLRDRLKMLGATRSGVIQAGDVDRQDTRPDRRHREEDQALPDGPDGRGMGAHRSLAAATGEARTQAQC